MEEQDRLGIKSIAFPLLGAGLGGLDRDKVIALMKKYLSRLDAEVFIYVERGKADEELVKKLMSNR